MFGWLCVCRAFFLFTFFKHINIYYIYIFAFICVPVCLLACWFLTFARIFGFVCRLAGWFVRSRGASRLREEALKRREEAVFLGGLQVASCLGAMVGVEVCFQLLFCV